MDGSRVKFGKCYDLKIFLKVCQCLGFAHFTYNSETRKFQQSRFLFCVSRILLVIGQSVSAGWVIFLSGFSIARYLNYTDELLGDSVEDHVKVLKFCQCSWIYISTYLLTRFYLTSWHVTLPMLNEMLAICYKLRVVTGIGIYSGFRYLLVLKLCLSIARIIFHFFPKWVTMIEFGDVASPIGIVLMDLTYWSHLYAHLCVLCFYLRMNEFLVEFSGNTKDVHRLISVSFRIHRLKYRLNKFFATLNVCCYLGLFTDIMNSYAVFVDLVRLRQYSELSWSICMDMVLKISTAFSTSYDVYLIGHVSEMITGTECLFRRKVFLLFCRKNDTNSVMVINVLLLKNHIQDLSTRAFNVFVTNRGFSFIYFMDIIVGYVIVCMQCFAAQQFSQGEYSGSISSTNSTSE